MTEWRREGGGRGVRQKKIGEDNVCEIQLGYSNIALKDMDPLKDMDHDYCLESCGICSSPGDGIIALDDTAREREKKDTLPSGASNLGPVTRSPVHQSTKHQGWPVSGMLTE